MMEISSLLFYPDLLAEKGVLSFLQILLQIQDPYGGPAAVYVLFHEHLPGEIVVQFFIVQFDGHGGFAVLFLYVQYVGHGEGGGAQVGREDLPGFAGRFDILLLKPELRLANQFIHRLLFQHFQDHIM